MNIKILLATISFLTLYNCQKNDNTEDKPNISSITKILPLGASRVEGSRPDYESFRFELWKNLKENNLSFDFIGTKTDNADYPLFNNEEFDKDHEGRIGWTSGEILENLELWLNQTGSPDIVLLSSPGGNDALEGLPYNQAVSNINSIVDILQINNPNVTIIIEQMAPGHSNLASTPLADFFEKIQQEVINIAQQQTTSTSQVITVDMFTGFNNNFLADEIHYNQAGAIFIANRYFDILENILE